MPGEPGQGKEVIEATSVVSIENFPVVCFRQEDAEHAVKAPAPGLDVEKLPTLQFAGLGRAAESFGLRLVACA